MMVILFIILGVVLVFGSALVLLRTARPPKVPDGWRVKPDEEDEQGW
jgi:hypothetical protein